MSQLSQEDFSRLEEWSLSESATPSSRHDLSTPPQSLLPRLPPEILYQVFEIEDIKPPEHNFMLVSHTRNYYDERRKFLRSASLVCRQWRGPACESLWKFVCVGRKNEVERIVSSPAFGEYAIQSLVILGSTGESNGKFGVKGGSTAKSDVFKLIESIRGLKELTLMNFGKPQELRWDFFFHKNLQSLTSLNLHHTYLWFPGDYRPSHLIRKYFKDNGTFPSLITSKASDQERPTFALQRLHLDSVGAWHTADLFTFFSSSKLREFRVKDVPWRLHSGQMKDLVTFMTGHAKQLSVLQIDEPELFRHIASLPEFGQLVNIPVTQSREGELDSEGLIERIWVKLGVQ